MKQISDHITIIPTTEIISQYKNSVKLKEAAQILKFISFSPVNFSQKSSSSSAGKLYTIELNCVFKGLAATVLPLINLKAIIGITLLDRSIIYLGSKDVPGVITITPGENNLTSILFKCQSKTPIIL